MITGHGATSGFETHLEDKTGATWINSSGITQEFMGKLMQRPEVAVVINFQSNLPQYLVDVDAAKSPVAGISPSTVLTHACGILRWYVWCLTSTGLVSYIVYISRLIRKTVLTRNRSTRYLFVTEPRWRLSLSLWRLPKRTDLRLSIVSICNIHWSEMVPRLRDIHPTGYQGYWRGGCKLCRLVTATNFRGWPAKSIKHGSGTTAIVFALCLIFVLPVAECPVAESYILPLVVILSIPFWSMGSFVLPQLFGLKQHLYADCLWSCWLVFCQECYPDYGSSYRREGNRVWVSVVGRIRCHRPFTTHSDDCWPWLSVTFASGENSATKPGLGGGIDIPDICGGTRKNTCKPIEKNGYDVEEVKIRELATV